MAVASRDFKLGKAAGGSQTIVAPVVLLTDVHSMGLELAQSLSFITGFYLGQGRRIPCLVEALLRTKARLEPRRCRRQGSTPRFGIT